MLAVLLAWEVPLARACEALARCSAPPGRMQPEGGGALPLALIDYAHTPDALAKALRAARAHCRGRLWCVFGCGGERDRGKRSEMGRIAARAADAAHRHRRQSARRGSAADRRRDHAGHRRRRRRGTRARDSRSRAGDPRGARARPRASDVVLVAGKGHEDYQLVGGERRALQRRRGGARGAGSNAATGMIRTPAAVRRTPVSGRLIGADRHFDEVAIDTRKLARRRSVRGAAPASTLDGHDFVAAAAAAGAAGAIVLRAQPALPLPQIVVAERRGGAGAAARAARAQFTGPVIGVAGSNGKTTVKEMIAAILVAARAVPGDARQSQQSSRRAADAAAPGRRAPQRGDRDGRQPSPATSRSWCRSRARTSG